MDGAAPFTKEEQHLQLHGTEALPPVFADFWRPNEHDLYSLLCDRSQINSTISII